MKPLTATRRVQFCAGHRVQGHENKCRNLHGHNYVVFFEARAGELDDLGRVIDFSVLKEKLGGWIDDNWDHGFVLGKDDQRARILIGGMAGQKMYIMPANPTAENMADYLLRIIGPRQLEDTGVELCRVTVWETENCYAVAEVSA